MPTIVKTPRKTKIWGVRNFSDDGGFNVGGSMPANTSLLGTLVSDLGITQLERVTLMRAVGHVWLGALGSASTAAYDTIQCGISWMSEDVAGQSAGSSAIPAPLEAGTRRQRWYHQWEFGGKERTSAAEVGMPLEHPDQSIYKFDITNQNRQNVAGDDLILTVNTVLGTWEAASVGIFGHINFMLALP